VVADSAEPVEEDEAKAAKRKEVCCQRVISLGESPCNCYAVQAKFATFDANIISRSVCVKVGIVHGVAGPGGILGVLPAVQMHSWGKAMLYLSSFCISSDLAMGLFAMIYGEATHRVGKLSAARLTFYLRVFSAFLSFAVGVVWIVLSALGMLGEVFG
jgi:hypothetical protein